MVDIVGLDSNMDTVKDSTKDRFVSKIRRFLGREDAQRRGDSPNWSSSSSSLFSFVILRFRITIIICDSFSASDFLEQIPDRISSWSGQQHSFIEELISLAFFYVLLARRWLRMAIQSSFTVHMLYHLILFDSWWGYQRTIPPSDCTYTYYHKIPTISNSIPEFW